MRGQIRGLGQAQRNLQDAVSMVQTAEGTLQEVHSMLQRVRELSVQYKNGTLSATNQAALQSEVNQRSEEHTSELQSRQYLVCRLLLEKKKKNRGYLTVPRLPQMIYIKMILVTAYDSSLQYAFTMLCFLRRLRILPK